MAKKRYPTSEVRGSGLECQVVMVQERRRGATLPPKTRTEAERSYLVSEVRAAAGRSHPASEARGGGWAEQPHVQGAVAARAQEGLEEPSHVEGREG